MTQGTDSTTHDEGDLRLGPRCVVVAPTFNHAGALGSVLQDLDRHQLAILVVNDGSTDHTETVLERWLQGPGGGAMRQVLRHSTNQGKAAALRTGFQEAVRLGFTHAATIDTDGQHDVEDCVRLIHACGRHADAIVIGARSRAGCTAPLASRLGRAISNGLVRVESGVRTTDSQSGLRVYPLATTLTIAGSAPRYGFETEVLVHAGWRGVPIVEHPIRSIYSLPGGRTTHFRIWGDTFAAVRMHLRLLVRSLGPGPVRVGSGGGQCTGTLFHRLLGSRIGADRGP